jgi:endo-1,4-beta-D-glucanase Y
VTRAPRAISFLLLLAGACSGGEEGSHAPPAAAAAYVLEDSGQPHGRRCGAPLASGPRADAEVTESYAAWKERYLTRFGRDGLLRVAAGEEYEDGTPSEAIGYGMLLAAYLNDRPTFDGLWAFARRFRNPRGLMAWSISPQGHVIDSNAATDGDEDMAFALLVAQDRWGGYAGDARTLITALLRHAVEPGTDVFRPGDVWGGSAVTNPSYFAPAYYKAFAEFTGEARWNRVADASYRILERVSARHAPATGLQPEWTTARGDSVREGDGYPFHYGYNAARVPWRLATDAAWNCDPRALRQVAKINAFFRRTGPSRIRDGYSLDGRVLGRYHNAAFVGPAAAAAVLADAPDYRQAIWEETTGLGHSNYFNDTLRLLSLLFASGKMPPPEVD